MSDLPSFPGREDVVKHLTDLSVVLHPSKTKLLGSSDALGGLLSLELSSKWCGQWHRNLAGRKIVLKLPELISLRLDFFRNGELVVICPKLAEAHFQGMASMSIDVEAAALDRLVLRRCEGVQYIVKDKLQSLQLLTVWKCGDVGGQLTEAVCHMTCLQTLEFRGFPAACMPRSFPASLRELWLHPEDWRLDLPGGLEELHELKSFRFDTGCPSLQLTKPLAELLPVDNLEHLRLGRTFFDCTACGIGSKAWGLRALGVLTWM